jgi:signal transduction histidine kinase
VLGPTDFQKKLLLGYGFALFAAFLIAVVSLLSLRSLERGITRVTDDIAPDLLEVNRLRTALDQEVTTSRGFLLSGDPTFLARMRAERANSITIARSLESDIDEPVGQKLVADIVAAQHSHDRVLDQLLGMKANGESSKNIQRRFEADLQPRKLLLDRSVEKLRLHEQAMFDAARADVSDTVRTGIRLTLLIALVGIVVAAVRSFGLSRSLAKLYQEAQDSIRLREDLVSIVSHDLKNPLTAIQLNTSLLKRSSEPLVGRSVQGIETACSTMQSLISDLLDVARIEAGVLPLQGEIREIPELSAEVIEGFRPIAQSRAVELELLSEYGRGVRSLASWVDPNRYQQILGNLVSNAIKFSPPNSRVRVEVSAVEKEVLVQVSDEGPGIPDQVLPVIFERFRQASGRDAQRGTGLGLYIARNLVAAHGGLIGVKSVLGRGSTFWFTLPMRKARAQDSQRLTS